MASVQGTAVRNEPPKYWTSGRVALATIVVAAVAAAFVVLYFLQAAFFCLFIGIVLATALRRPVAWLERRGLQHVTAVVLVFGVLVVVLLVALGLGIPLLTHQALELRQALPGFYEQARDRFVNSTTGLAHQFAMQLSPKLPWPTSGSTDGHATAEFAPPAFRYLGDFAFGLFMVVAVLMLAFYWSLQEDRTLKALLLLVPVPRRDAARELIDALQAKVGDFIYGQATLCIAIGILTFIAYTIVGLPHALPLAILSGLLETVPVFGLIASALPAALVALSISGGKFFGVVIAITAIHLTDNFFLSPKIMGRSVGLHPIVTLLALVGFGELFGLAGAVLAILLASISQMLMDRFLLSREAQAALPISGRDHISLLRHEAQELLQDVRQNLRHKDDASTPVNDHFEEAIETIAVELDQMLSAESAQREGMPRVVEVTR
jgi:predicted PurR-regulated permease PerM